MISFIVFIFVVYGIAFLAADAKIFGCPTSTYLDHPETDYANEIGIIKLRQKILRLKFFQELLECYFCLGVWCGGASHAVLLFFYREVPSAGNEYFLGHPDNFLGIALSFLVAVCIGGPICYMLDLITKIAEKKAE